MIVRIRITKKRIRGNMKTIETGDAIEAGMREKRHLLKNLQIGAEKRTGIGNVKGNVKSNNKKIEIWKEIDIGEAMTGGGVDQGIEVETGGGREANQKTGVANQQDIQNSKKNHLMKSKFRFIFNP